VKTIFFGCHEGKLQTFAKICVVASLETLREYPTVRIRDKQAAWKLLGKISRTAPDLYTATDTRTPRVKLTRLDSS